MLPESGFRIAPTWPWIGEMTMTSQFSDIESSSIFFWRFFLSFVKFSCWSKFHVNIITSSEVMIIYFYKGSTRNPEIRNTPIWVLPNIWRLGQVSDTKFGMDVSNEMLLNAAKMPGLQLLPFTVSEFWVIKGKPTGVGKNYPHPPHTHTFGLWLK